MKQIFALFTLFLVTVCTILSSCEANSLATRPTPPLPTNTPTLSPPPTHVYNPTQHALPSNDVHVAAALNTFLSELYEQQKFSGIVLVAHGDQIIFQRAYGFADRDLQLPITNETRFYIGALTNQFTAAAILLLSQEGKLSLYDSICNYLDDCHDDWRLITIHHLLTHTSGLPVELGILYIDPITPDAIQKTIAARTTSCQPGRQFAYCNAGYILAGRIIEQVSGMSYGDFLEQHFFRPLGMHNSGYGDAGVRCARGYYSAVMPARRFEPSVEYSAGGIYSTAEDLLRWDQALYSDIVLTETNRNRLFTGYTAIPWIAEDWKYGYGWVLGELEGHRWISHSGRLPGYKAVLDRYIDDRYTFITLFNQENADIGPIRAGCIRIVLDL